MRILYIANTYFELELSGQLGADLPANLDAVPLIWQLQYLPFLYASPEDGVLCTETPEPRPKFAQAKAIDCQHPSVLWDEVRPWGWSPSVTNYLDAQGIDYLAPPWTAVQRVNRKDWCFKIGPRLPGAQLLHDAQELSEWTKNSSWPLVIKTVYGVSGRGHRIFSEPCKELEHFAAREWKKGRPVIGEAWLCRTADFSTQWELGSNGQQQLIGLTGLENDARGGYHASVVGGDEPPHFAEHLNEARKILEAAHREGYFGPLGIDAFLYDDDRLHAVVEVNARLTMARAALDFRDAHFPGKRLRMSYNPGTDGLLPQGRSKRQLRYSLT